MMKNKTIQFLKGIGISTFLFTIGLTVTGCANQPAEAATQQITSSQELMSAGANSTVVSAPQITDLPKPVPASGERVPITDTSAYIGEDKAKEIAFTHAGVAEEDTTGLRIKLDYDDGRTEYEIEFLAGTKEYDYDIDAITGTIVSFDYDIEYNNIASVPSGSSAPAADSAGLISEEAARKLALEQVPGATDSHIRISLDYDDGITVYEGKIVYNGIEYEFEINAADGSFLEWDVDLD